ncbi:MAG: glutamine synthetase family protein [Thermoleophilia bacterium]
MSNEQVLATVEERDVKFIRLWFTDILGRLKSFAITRGELPRALAEGIAFDGSSIAGFNSVQESDMVAVPDPGTFTILPYRPQEAAVGRLFCDIRVPDGSPYEGDPRQVLRRSLERARRMGYDEVSLEAGLEYFYFRSPDAAEVLDRGGYFDLTTLDAASDLRRDTVTALEQVGIATRFSHHEVGPSQHEIDVGQAAALRMADNVMTHRTVVKEIAARHGCYATFMPKPLTGENGSGMHTRQTLFRNGVNAFYDGDDPHFLSQEGRAFIAGLLRHAREVACVFAQWVNSYKRLVPGFEAPVYAAWSRRNRSAIVRVPPRRPDDGEVTRVELRGPDPACNPYLTFAALLEAGLNGIERGYALPPSMEQNLYDLAPDEIGRMGIEALPQSLGEAIELGAGSELLLTCFGEHIHTRYVELKRAEWEEYRAQVTPYELERYLPLL